MVTNLQFLWLLVLWHDLRHFDSPRIPLQPQASFQATVEHLASNHVIKTIHIHRIWLPCYVWLVRGRAENYMMRHFYMINRNKSFVEKESQWYRYRLSCSNVEKCKLHLAVTQVAKLCTVHVLFSQEKIHWPGTSIDKIYRVMLWGTLLPRGREIIWTKLDGFLQIKDEAYKFIQYFLPRDWHWLGRKLSFKFI